MKHTAHEDGLVRIGGASPLSTVDVTWDAQYSGFSGPTPRNSYKEFGNGLGKPLHLALAKSDGAERHECT
jgi:hypothetical protein